MFSAIRAPMATSTSRQWWRNTDNRGRSGAAPPSARRASARRSAAWNTGDSSTDRRTHIPSTTSRPESRNGTRQPHRKKASSDSSAVSAASTPVASSWPAGAPVCGQEAQ